MSKQKIAIRLLAIICIIAMSFVGCASGSTDSTSGASSTVSVSDESGAEDAKAEPFGVYDTPIEFTYAYQTQPIIDFPPGDSFENNIWTRELEKYGIKMNIIWAADSASGAYKTKINLAIASGDIPDVFVGDYSVLYSCYEAGLIADISEVFDQCASDDVKAIKQNNEDLFQSSYIDGKLVAIPSLGTPIELTAEFLWIRDDWMANLNLKAPETMEDVIEIARTFTYDDPDGNGQNDTYGFGMDKNLFVRGFGSIKGFAAAYGVPTLEHERNDMWFIGSDGKMTNGNIQPGMKEALLTMQTMYADGLLDKEFGVKDSSALKADINESKVGMFFGSNSVCYQAASLYNSDHNAIFRPYPIPAAEGHELVQSLSWPVLTYQMISTNCKNPELIIKLANINNLINNDNMTAETSAIYADNNVWMLSPIIMAEPSSLEQAQEITDAIRNNDGGVNISTQRCRDRYDMVIDFINTGNNDNEGYGRWGSQGPDGAAMIVLEDYIPNNKLMLTSVIGRQPASLVENLPNLNDMRVQVFTEIIMGGSIDKFDTFVEDWLNAGGQKILDDLTEIYG